MNYFENKLSQLNDILIQNQLGFIYDFKNEKENGLILPFFAKYMDLLNELNHDFCVTTDLTSRAGILYKEKLIFISHGLFSRLCKLSSLMFNSGVFNGNMKKLKYFDLNLVERPFEEFFPEQNRNETKSESYLFLFIFDCLLSFIVHHELGHLFNGHGDRVDTSDDIEGHRKIASEKTIQSHCRELVADNFAFISLNKKIKQSIDNADSQTSDLLECFKGEFGPTIMTLTIIGSYFTLMDGSGYIDHFSSTHPIAPVRIHSIYASFLDRYLDTPNEALAKAVIYLTLDNITNIFKIVNSDFKLNLYSKTSTPEMTNWSKAIFIEYPNWVVS